MAKVAVSIKLIAAKPTPPPIYLNSTATWEDITEYQWAVNTTESSSVFKMYNTWAVGNPGAIENYIEWLTHTANISNGSTWTMTATPVIGAFYRIAVDELTNTIVIIPG